MKFFAFTLAFFCIVAVIGCGWAWVTMIIAEQKEFNADEDSEPTRWTWLNFRAWLKRIALRRVFVLTPATWISAGCGGGKWWQARFGLWITETYGAS